MSRAPRHPIARLRTRAERRAALYDLAVVNPAEADRVLSVEQIDRSYRESYDLSAMLRAMGVRP